MRDDIWLQELLDNTWDSYFADVPQANTVRIVFGKRAKRQLGSIRRDRKQPEITIITLNGLFKSPDIPAFIPQATLVHELTHYAHGFNSPLEQKHAHPHAGGVIRAEYAERGLLWLYQDQQKWLKANWPAIVAANFAPTLRRARKRPDAIVRANIKRISKPFWMERLLGKKDEFE